MGLTQRKPIPKIGRVGKRWAAWRRQQAEVVRKRSGNLCEGCGKDSRPLQVAHLMGRRNIIAEPWASWAGMCAHLCSAHPSYGLGCHEKVDQRRDTKLRDWCLERAWLRMCFEYGRTELPDPPDDGPWSFDDLIRFMVRGLE